MKIKAALFKNTRKAEEKQPDYTGTGDLETGGKVRLSAWLRTSKAGQKYLSIAIEDERQRDAAPANPTPPSPQPAPSATQAGRSAAGTVVDDLACEDAGPDDIPF